MTAGAAAGAGASESGNFEDSSPHSKRFATSHAAWSGAGVRRFLIDRVILSKSSPVALRQADHPATSANLSFSGTPPLSYGGVRAYVH
jgi:hypothetical protein